MKKLLLLGSALYLLIGAAANAQVTEWNFGVSSSSGYDAYPHDRDWNRSNQHYDYWRRQERARQDAREWERQRQEAWQRDCHHHYAYGKNHPKHDKKNCERRRLEAYGQEYDWANNQRHDDNR